ncbi:MAG: ATP-binding protein [Haloferacaceae archaeon]
MLAITDRDGRALQQYERLVETLPIGYARTTVDGEFRAVNATFVALVGGDSREDVLSRDVEEFYRDPTTRDRLLTTLREEGEVHNEELKVTTLDGETVWVVVTARVVDTDEGRCIDALVQDITDRRRRESVLREMHDVISDRDRAFEEQVRALLELGRAELDTRYGTLSEIRGEEYVFEVVAADDDSIRAGDVVPLSATNCEIAASTERTLVLGDVERDAPEETDRAGYAEWGISCYVGAPVLVEDEVYGTFCFYDTEARTGQFSAWEVTLVDLMSRWVSYELQRRRANARLEEQNAQLERFASIVAHDLQNPLNVAQLRAELASEECDSEHLDHVMRAHDRMEALIDDLLRLALEGEQLGELETVDPAALVEACWDDVETRDATLRATVERSIRADPDRLRQLFENLVSNAVEHGGGTVTVTVGPLEDGFYVEDDGRGIPADERDEVFGAGYSTADRGTGFGLNIVEQVADAHGWEVRVTEGADGGARFEITGVEFAGD